MRGLQISIWQRTKRQNLRTWFWFCVLAWMACTAALATASAHEQQLSSAAAKVSQSDFGPGLLPAGKPLSKSDKTRLGKIFKLLNRTNLRATTKWSRIQKQAKGLKSQPAKDLVTWFNLTRSTGTPSFARLSQFINGHKIWPYQARLKLNLESAAVRDAIAPAKALAKMGDARPKSGLGMMLRGEALLAQGRKADAKVTFQKAWVFGDFGKADQKVFYRRHRKHLTYNDHVKRADYLLWNDRATAARRMLRYLKGGRRNLVEARIALMKRRGNVDRAIARVPKELRNDTGLVYERLRWRRRKGRLDSARELLQNLPPVVPFPEKWWVERAILARSSLKQGNISQAYDTARLHGITPPDGTNSKVAQAYADAEWLTGWIALRFLDSPQQAIENFEALYTKVRYPVSRSRAAYWAGRAHERHAEMVTYATDKSGEWYAKAGKHPTTFYGQQALIKISPNAPLPLPAPVFPNQSDRMAFVKHELVQAIKILDQFHQRRTLQIFMRSLENAKDAPSWRALTANLARSMGRPDVGVGVAKRALRDGAGFLTQGYPVLALRGEAPEPALVWALVRQESAFDIKAKSPSGARGLMQLMPRTAKVTAKKMKLRYSKKRLTEDSGYNLDIGRAYLAEVLKRFDSSYPLALAAYNAGPHRAKSWIREYGDPRDPEVDLIDWVETIPFRETRNYVQRVLENLTVYRRLVSPEVAQTKP